MGSSVDSVDLVEQSIYVPGFIFDNLLTVGTYL